MSHQSRGMVLDCFSARLLRRAILGPKGPDSSEVLRLLGAGIRPDVTDERDSSTPLHWIVWAVDHPSADMREVRTIRRKLLAMDADVRAKDAFGMSPWDYSCAALNAMDR